ncbi:thioredoxin family protein [Zunongwangia sp. F363]|uniref:Thioredoxin family protein n=1 Tax=Autumnicola tepida TaxID=3075595 RepID=A0ABU3C5S4_9FLAO|nr:thioredoxin family protein [Zunongwangia sp. F363]MDT0641688.1 thioredoxin family protein [Zunongwangia sp. F363]
MNNFLSLFLLVFLSCGSASSIHSEKEINTSAEVNRAEQQGMLLGKVERKDLEEEPYASWFNQGYEDYKPGEEAVETIEDNISDYKIKVIFGTWCPDSRREVPKIFKLLDEADYDMDDLSLIAVDRRKSTPDNLEEGLNVKRVPTVIFYKNGEEVNRFVEYPQESLEEDIAKIVSEEEYTNPYAK